MKNVVIYIVLPALISCSDSEYYKVQFDDVDRLTEGDKVFLKGLEVGEVKDLTLDEDKKILATVWVGRNIKLTKGSTFTIHSDILGSRRIEIGLADSQELMDNEDVHAGYIQPPDTTRTIRLTGVERDSLLRHVYTLADSVLLKLSKSNDARKEEQ
jgi:ABC-type transporter Mla subunit MlaD